jgi:hypothetical protein
MESVLGPFPSEVSRPGFRLNVCSTALTDETCDVVHIAAFESLAPRRNYAPSRATSAFRRA